MDAIKIQLIIGLDDDNKGTVSLAFDTGEIHHIGVEDAKALGAGVMDAAEASHLLELMNKVAPKMGLSKEKVEEFLNLIGEERAAQSNLRYQFTH